MNGHVGVLHTGALGDCVLALHAVRAWLAAMRLPGAGARPSVTVWARSPIARLAVGRSFVTASRDVEAAGLHTLFAVDGPIDADVRRRLCECDVVISFCGSRERPPASRLVAAGVRDVRALDPRVRAETAEAGRHCTAQWLADLGAADAALIENEPLLHVAGDSATAAPADRPILIHPGSGGQSKCWPIERYEALAGALLRRGRRVAWMVGPVEHERDGAPLTRRLARTAEVVYEERLDVAAARIATAAAFVGNDAGTTHLAAALGVPAIAIFGPTDARVWRPIGPRVRIFAGDASAHDPFAGIDSDGVADAVVNA